MHMLYNHVHPKVLQALLGHEKSESTEVYTKVFALDVAAGKQVGFSLDTARRCSCCARRRRPGKADIGHRSAGRIQKLCSE